LDHNRVNELKQYDVIYAKTAFTYSGVEEKAAQHRMRLPPQRGTCLRLLHAHFCECFFAAKQFTNDSFVDHPTPNTEQAYDSPDRRCQRPKTSARVCCQAEPPLATNATQPNEESKTMHKFNKSVGEN
jgi:hypothetical protein